MKKWMELIPISAKVHRRQSRMTRICIVLAVALVSVIFGMADMAIRCQKMQAIQTDGSWHAAFKGLTGEQEALLRARPEAEVAAWYDAVNYRLDQNYMLEGTQTVVCGMEEEFLALFPFQKIVEGEFPREKGGAVFTKSVKERLGLTVGDSVALTLPDGTSVSLTVTGFTGDTSMLTASDAFGMFVSRETFAGLAPEEAPNSADGVLYVQFTSYCRIQKTLEDIRLRLGLAQDQVTENARLLGLMGQSSSDYIGNLYLVAAILAVLVMAAGIMMIAGSLNSNIAQRTGFFGMLRCLGATPRQILRFVRCEALNWCKTAVPAGLLAGLAVIWILCAMLRRLSPAYFGEMPVWGISLPGILIGTLLGMCTVLLAAQAPAKRAAGVSPLAAVSGNAGTVHEVKKAAGTGFFGVETALGIHHAVGGGKNFALMAGSFAFTIILFLAFSATIDFMGHAVTPLRPYTPDLSIVSRDNTCSVKADLVQELAQNPAVKRVYGRRFAYHVPASVDGQEGMINLISYEKYQFGWAEDAMLEGSAERAQNGDGVMICYAYGGENSAGLGSVIDVELNTPKGGDGAAGSRQLEVCAVLSNCPFDREAGAETVICSEELFERLTGETDYTIIDVQLAGTATEEDVARIRNAAGTDVSFLDQRMSNQEARGAYFSYAVFLYGFLTIIALISAFHVINSIAMSVSARMRQYGAMRAVGMSGGQLVKTVAAEGLTYVLWGTALGCACGLPIHKFIFEYMVTSRWGDAWYVPVRYLAIIISVVTASAAAAVWGPARRIQRMSVVDTIGECQE